MCLGFQVHRVTLFTHLLDLGGPLWIEGKRSWRDLGRCVECQELSMCLVKEAELGEDRWSLSKRRSRDSLASRINIKWKEGESFVHFVKVPDEDCSDAPSTGLYVC